MKWFINIKLKSKLLLSFTVVSLVAAGTGLVGITKIRTIDARDTMMYEKMVIPFSDLQQITGSFQKIRILIRDIVAANESSEVNRYAELITNEKDNISRHEKSFEKTILTEQGRRTFQNFTEAYNNYLPLLDKVMLLAKADNDTKALEVVNGKMGEAANAADYALNDLSQRKLEIAKETSDSNTEIADGAVIFMVSLIILGLIVSTLLSFYIAGYISKGINLVIGKFRSLDQICLTNLAKGSEELAEGNLNVKITTGTTPLEVYSKDEVGMLSENLNAIIIKIQQTVSSVENAVQSIRSVIEESSHLVKAAVNGNLSLRGRADEFKGGYRELVEGLNKTFDAVVRPINDSGEVLEVLASGDLTARMRGEYKGEYSKIKESINSLADAFCAALGDVSEAVHATASAASEISSSSEQMAAGSQEQSQQTNEVASAVEQMTKTIFESSQYAARAAENSRLASESASEGQKKVEDTKRGMLKIVNSTKSTGEKITSLAKKTEQIGEITQVIDDIADQTNLLALNAAIEAARAGEQGRGFAVVADEVRKLAERTTKATKEIAETIKLIQSEAKQADNSMSEAGKAVEEGMVLTEAVSQSLCQILQGNQKVSDIVSQVAAASEEQSSAAEEISKNIEGISSVTQQSAAGTEQIARAAEDLNRLTLNLQMLVSRFKINSNEVSTNRMAIRKDGRLARA